MVDLIPMMNPFPMVDPLPMVNALLMVDLIPILEHICFEDSIPLGNSILIGDHTYVGPHGSMPSTQVYIEQFPLVQLKPPAAPGMINMFLSVSDAATVTKVETTGMLVQSILLKREPDKREFCIKGTKPWRQLPYSICSA